MPVATVVAVSAPSNFLPSPAVSQFPTRTPNRLTPFTRAEWLLQHPG